MCKKLLLLCLCLCLLLSACAKPSENTTPQTTAPTTATEPSPTTPTEAIVPTDPYDAILTALINDTELPLEATQKDFYYDNLNYEDLSDIGYAFLDVDSDGQQELLVSEFDRPPVFYLYTIQHGKAGLQFISSERCYYTLYENGHITCRWLAFAGLSGKDFFRLENGSLVFQERITLDVNHAEDAGIISSVEDANNENCYFLSDTPNAEDYRHVTKDVAVQRIAELEDQLTPLEFTLIPLSEYRK